jgi:hypothetical protein
MLNRLAVFQLTVSITFIVLVVTSGCGGADGGSVKGTVLRRDGSPLVGARVVARSADTGKSVYGTTGPDGQFELAGGKTSDGVPPGNYDVVVLEDRGDPDRRSRPTVATKYRDPATSGLKLTVETGETKEFDIELDPR